MDGEDTVTAAGLHVELVATHMTVLHAAAQHLVQEAIGASVRHVIRMSGLSIDTLYHVNSSYGVSVTLEVQDIKNLLQSLTIPTKSRWA